MKRLRIDEGDLILVCVTLSSESERWRTAANPSTPVSVLRVLAHDPSPLVRDALLDNPCLPKDVFSLLLNDSDPKVRRAAKFFKKWRKIT